MSAIVIESRTSPRPRPWAVAGSRPHLVLRAHGARRRARGRGPLAAAVRLTRFGRLVVVLLVATVVVAVCRRGGRLVRVGGGARAHDHGPVRPDDVAASPPSGCPSCRSPTASSRSSWPTACRPRRSTPVSSSSSPPAEPDHQTAALAPTFRGSCPGASTPSGHAERRSSPRGAALTLSSVGSARLATRRWGGATRLWRVCQLDVGVGPLDCGACPTRRGGATRRWGGATRLWMRCSLDSEGRPGPVDEVLTRLGGEGGCPQGVGGIPDVHRHHVALRAWGPSVGES